MAKYHPLYDSVWNDVDLEGLPFEGKAFFVFLWSNPRMRSSGIYRISDQQLALDTGLSVRRIGGYLSELTKRGRIVRDGQWIFVRGYLKRQPNTPRLINSALAEANSCNSIAILKAFSERYPTLNLRPSVDHVSKSLPGLVDHVSNSLPRAVQSSTEQSSTEQLAKTVPSRLEPRGSAAGEGDWTTRLAPAPPAPAPKAKAETIPPEQWAEHIRAQAAELKRKFGPAAAKTPMQTTASDEEDVPF